MEDSIEDGNIFIKTAKDKIALIGNSIDGLETQIMETQVLAGYEKRQKELTK
jgi:hypothetical protein